MSANFVSFTDADGIVWQINTKHVISIRTSEKATGKNVITLQDGTRLLSAAQSLADTTAVFGLLPPKFTRINLSASGDTTLISAVASKKIRVLGYCLSTELAGNAVTLQFKSGAGTVLAGYRELDGLFPVTYSGTVLSPAFETASGEALTVNLSAGKAVEGHLTYVEV